MSRNNQDKDISNVLWVDFRSELYENIRKFDIVMFEDDDGSMKVIKSRYPINENKIF